MACSRNSRMLSLLMFALAVTAGAQTASKPPDATAAWTVKVNGDIRWQQVTPAGALLVSTDSALIAVDVESGKISWQKSDLGGLAIDDVHMVESSILMEASRQGLLRIFDPVSGTTVFDSRQLGLTKVVTRRVLPQSGTLVVHGQRAAGPPVVALYGLTDGKQLWVNESLFAQTEPKKKGFGAVMQGLMQLASESTELEVMQAGPDTLMVHTLSALQALDARTGAVKWSTTPAARAAFAHHFRLFPSEKPDRIYASFDDGLMAYRLADGQPLWAKPAKVDGRLRAIVQHPAGIVMLPEAAPEGEAGGSRRIVNGVVQTGLNVARYEDGTTIAPKPIRMRGNVIDAMIAGNSVVLAVDAESRTFVNVLDVATASLRLKKDVKIKGQLSYAKLMPAGLLYISRPDATINAEVNIIDLETGQQRFKDAIESGKPLSSNDYNAARYYLHYATEGRTLYVFSNRDNKLYALDCDTGNFRALGGEIKLQGGEDPTSMELRSEGIVLSSAQNLVIVARDGQVKERVYYPAPQLPGLLRALYAVNAVRAGLYGAAASAYGESFAQASRQASDPVAQQVTDQLATAYSQAGQQLEGYSRQSMAMVTKRFKASLNVPGFVFMLTKAPEGHGNVLMQVDKDTAQPRASVSLGKEREPAYAVDDISNMLFLQTAPGTLVGYSLATDASANLVGK
jgi:outer membrane protein assembly factor BamB